MINTLIHSHSSLENHTPFQTKLGKIYTLFQAETVQLKIIPFGAAHTYVAHLYKKVLPGLCKRLFFKIFPSRKKKYPLQTRQNQFTSVLKCSRATPPWLIPYSFPENKLTSITPPAIVQGTMK